MISQGLSIAESSGEGGAGGEEPGNRFSCSLLPLPQLPAKAQEWDSGETGMWFHIISNPYIWEEG